jgi:hypothetical protein
MLIVSSSKAARDLTWADSMLIVSSSKAARDLTWAATPARGSPLASGIDPCETARSAARPLCDLRTFAVPASYALHACCTVRIDLRTILAQTPTGEPGVVAC